VVSRGRFFGARPFCQAAIIGAIAAALISPLGNKAKISAAFTPWLLAGGLKPKNPQTHGAIAGSSLHSS
jgi:hypothetical protein